MKTDDKDFSKDDKKKEVKEEKEEKEACVEGDEKAPASKPDNGAGKRPPIEHYQPPVVPVPQLFGRVFAEGAEQASDLIVRMARSGMRCIVAIEGKSGWGKTALLREICRRVKAELRLDVSMFGNSFPPASPYYRGRLMAYDNVTHPQSGSIQNAITSEQILVVAAFDPDAPRSPDVAVIRQFADLTIRLELPDADTAGQMVRAFGFDGHPRSAELQDAALRVFAPLIGSLTPREIMLVLQFAAVELQRIEKAGIEETADCIAARALKAVRECGKKNAAEKTDTLSYVDPDSVRQLFHGRLIGQDAMIGRILPWIVAYKSGFRDKSRPAGVFLFYGATGCGKTETARVIADELFGGRLHKEDMNTYNTEHSVARFIGSPPGYVDSNKLTPFLSFIGEAAGGGVILLDEIEKAHPVVMDHIMEMLDTGFFRSANGRVVDARGMFIIMTSNVVTSRSASSRRMGFGDVVSESNENDMEPLRKSGLFRDEFLGRIQLAVFFEELSPDAVRGIARKLYISLVDGVPAALREKVRREEEIDELAAAYDAKTGARSLRNYIASTLEMKLLKRCNEAMAAQPAGAVK